MALKVDPNYAADFPKRFYENPAAASRTRLRKAWYKLTHRDMGPVSRVTLGKLVPVGATDVAGPGARPSITR